MNIIQKFHFFNKNETFSQIFWPKIRDISILIKKIETMAKIWPNTGYWILRKCSTSTKPIWTRFGVLVLHNFLDNQNLEFGFSLKKFLEGWNYFQETFFNSNTGLDNEKVLIDELMFSDIVSPGKLEVLSLWMNRQEEIRYCGFCIQKGRNPFCRK